MFFFPFLTPLLSSGSNLTRFSKFLLQKYVFLSTKLANKKTTRFPFNDKDRLQQWIHNVKRKSWTPKKNSRLFAVPTIFYPHCHVKAKTDSDTQGTVNTGKSVMTMITSVALAQTVQMSVASCTSTDHGAYTLKNSPSPLKRKVSFVQSCLRSCKKKLKLQDQRVRRLKQKVKSLSSVVTDLKEKLLVSTNCGDVLVQQHSCRPRLYRGIIRCPPIPCGGRKEEGKMVRRLFVLL
uniref:THAP-type domain-containing protein n=1 Tax=Sander lucioperca TaxID=283035 RepID=A0A8C9Y0F3_SANLU